MVEEVLQGFEQIGREFDTFCLLQPTSPLRTPDDISAAYELYYAKKATAVVSLCELEHPISWCGPLGENSSLDMRREQGKQRQTQKKYYRVNGAIYIVSISEFRKDAFLYREMPMPTLCQKSGVWILIPSLTFGLQNF